MELELLEINLDEKKECESRLNSGYMQGRKKVFIETYGCQMNVSDSELIMGILHKVGYITSPSLEKADLVLLNTCAIREHAEERVVGRLGQLSYLKVKRPDMVLGVCGCMAKHLVDRVFDRAPFVDLILGPDSYRKLPEMVAELTSEPALDLRLDRKEHYQDIDPSRREGTNAWVTIIRGCDKFCTFCIVPYVRGRERSLIAEEVVRQVEIAASEGFQEVTLLGQTVNSYFDGHHDFSDLLRMVACVDGIRRIRFTSPHPADFSEKLIETMAHGDKICNSVHLPVQSGSDQVLENMGRTYTSEKYLNLVDRLRESMPGLCLSTDVIVGFPGETLADFEATLDLIRKIRFDSAFTFKYSPRKGTVAYREIPDTVPEEEKSLRLEKIITLQNKISEEINRGYIGRVLEVLIEGDARKGAGRAVGKSDGFKTVVFPRCGFKNNKLINVKITKSTLRTLSGVISNQV